MFTLALLGLIIYLGQSIDVREASFYINSSEKIAEPKFKVETISRAEELFASYAKGDYDIIVKDCTTNTVLKKIAGIGDSRVRIILDASSAANACVRISIEKFGVEKDGTQVYFA